MISLYGQYIAERENKFIVEDDCGFATYSFGADYCYIEDIFVSAKHRKSGIAAKYADQIAAIALQKGIKQLLGTVRPSAQQSTESLQVLLSYGFKLLKSEVDAVYFIKEIGAQNG